MRETMLQDRRYYRDEIKAARARRFAAQLADALYDLHITHKALARELGISLHTVDSWTRAVDPNVPGEPNLNRLCALLERTKPGAGVQVAKAVGHKWEAPAGEPAQLRSVASVASVAEAT